MSAKTKLKKGELKGQILAALAGLDRQSNAAEIAELVGATAKSTAAVLLRLAKSGDVERVDRGVYQLPRSGTPVIVRTQPPVTLKNELTGFTQKPKLDVAPDLKDAITYLKVAEKKVYDRLRAGRLKELDESHALAIMTLRLLEGGVR